MSKKPGVRRWENISGQKLATAIFDAVKGDCRKLTGDPKAIDSIWGVIAKCLGSTFKTITDQMWVKTSWELNKLGVQNLHEQICKDRLVVVQKTLTSDSSLMFEKEQVHCICQKPEKEIPEYSMIACDDCFKWYHCKCLKVNKAKYKDPNTWRCPRCSGDTTFDFVPRVFRNSFRNQDSESNISTFVEDNNGSPGSDIDNPDTINEQEIMQPLTRSRIHPRDCPTFETENNNQTTVPNLHGPMYTSTPLQPEHSCQFRRDSSENNVDEMEHVVCKQTDQKGDSPPFGALNSQTRGGQEEEQHAVSQFLQEHSEKSFQAHVLQYQHLQQSDSEDEVQSRNEDFVYQNENEEDEMCNAEYISPGSPTASEVFERSEPNNSDCIEGPKKYSLELVGFIQRKDWKSIKPTESEEYCESRYKFKLKRDVWSHVFGDVFMSICPDAMKGCVLSFKKGHRISVRKQRGVDFPSCVEARAWCTRKPLGCGMVYDFVISNVSDKNEDVKLNIRCYGTLLHDLSIPDKRRLAGIKRVEARKELEHKTASVYKRTIHGQMVSDAAGQKALEKGNVTSVQNLNVLRKAREEEFAKDDLDKNIFIDLFLRREKFKTFQHLQGNLIAGFIQELSVFPFYITMYTERQMNILKRLLVLNKHTVLHLDSTGSVSGKLPDIYGTTRQFYYALVVSLPGVKDAPCIPIFELVSNSHSAATISHALHWFFEAYGNYSPSKGSAFGIPRIETDGSRALVSAVVQSLEQGTTLMYLKTAWLSLVRNEKMDFVHHICRSHAIKFVADAIKNHYKSREDSQKLLTRWFKRFVMGKSLYDFERRVNDVVLIAGKPTLTEEVENVIENIELPSTKTGPLKSQQLSLESIPKNTPFYVRSPFSFFTILRCHRHKICIHKRFYKVAALSFDNMPYEDSDTDTDVEGSINPHHNIEFLQYLLKNVLYMACLFDHSLLALNETDLSQDTNAVSEAWNKILKNDELKMELPMRIGRLVSRLEDNLKGRVAQFELAVSRLEMKAGVSRKKSIGRPSEHDLSDSGGDEEISRYGKKTAAVHNPERSTEMWGKGKGTRRPTRAEDMFFELPLIPYGGKFQYGGEKILLHNTCNIDNILQILYTLFSINQPTKIWLTGLAQEQESTGEKLLQIFGHLENGQTNLARKLTLTNLLNLPISDLKQGDMYNSEDRVLREIGDLFIVRQKFYCTNKRCNLPKESDICPMRDSAVVFPESINEIFASEKILSSCIMCNFRDLLVKKEWPAIGAPPFFCYCLEQVGNVCKEVDVLSAHIILGVRFKLFAYTVLENNHYTTVFLYKGKRYIYDGLRSQKLQKYSPAGDYHSISTVWLLKDD